LRGEHSISDGIKKEGAWTMSDCPARVARRSESTGGGGEKGSDELRRDKTFTPSVLLAKKKRHIGPFPPGNFRAPSPQNSGTWPLPSKRARKSRRKRGDRKKKRSEEKGSNTGH